LASPSGPHWVIERLGPQHDRESFDCGKPTLTSWLKERAGQFERKNLARAYVAVRPGQPLVLGYYSLSTHHVAFEALPPDQAKGLPPRMEVPVVLLGRLAVDRAAQGQGLGGLLLIDALRRALRVAEQIGIRAVEVDAIDEVARDFYRHYGFITLADDPLHLYLSLKAVEALGLTPKG
jgi:GNAT superfamily N-acetyltransferase